MEIAPDKRVPKWKLGNELTMGWSPPRRKVAVARRRDGSDGVTLGTVATARNGYLPSLFTE